MPLPLVMPPPLLLLLVALLLAAAPPPSAAAAASSSFSLDFFPTTDTAALSQLALSGGATATAAAVSMPTPTARVQYRAPINLAAFSTYFAFALPAPASSLAFFLTPSSASAEPPALAVLFSARHVRVDLAARAAALHARYPTTTLPNRTLHAWIDYNATSATLHVRLSAARLVPGPDHHRLLSAPLDLSPVLRRVPVVAGFRTPSGNCTLFSWAFRASPPPYYDTRTMHSQPLDPAVLLAAPPPHRAADSHHHSPPWGAAASLLLAAACGAVLTFLLLFLWYTVTARRPVAPVDHHHPSDVAYHKIVLVGVKDDAAAADHHAHPPSAPSS